MAKERRKAFQDIGKWIIFLDKRAKAWTVTPPFGVDHEVWEKSFPTYDLDVAYFRRATR